MDYFLGLLTGLSLANTIYQFTKDRRREKDFPKAWRNQAEDAVVKLKKEVGIK